MRRRESTCQHIRQPSARDGGASSSSRACSASPAARCSWAPRRGSRSVAPAATRARVGTAKPEERRPPAERLGHVPRPDAAHQGTDRVARPVEGEDPGPPLDRVVVGEQGRVRGLDERLAHLHAGHGERQRPDAPRQADRHREDREDDAAHQRQAHPVAPVGDGGDRHRQPEGGAEGQHERHGHAGHARVELVRDGRARHRQRHPGQLVDGVEAEEDGDRRGRPVPGQVVEPPHRVAQPAREPPPPPTRPPAALTWAPPSLGAGPAPPTARSRVRNSAPPSPPGTSSSTSSTPRAELSSRHSPWRNHCPPLRNTAPSTAPVSDPRPPTTAALNVVRFSSAGNRARVNCPFCTASSAPATPARNPERAKAVSLARAAEMP